MLGLCLVLSQEIGWEGSTSPKWSTMYRVKRKTSTQSIHIRQGVALAGRNRTGPPCSVGRPTAHAAGPAAADRPRARRRPTCPPASSVTDDDKRQTTDASEQNNTGPLGWPVITHWVTWGDLTYDGAINYYVNDGDKWKKGESLEVQNYLFRVFGRLTTIKYRKQ